MAKQKFTAPQGNPYNSIIQSTEQQQQPEPAAKTEYYRFNAKLPMECKDYLQEMAWRNRTTITEYLTRLILADMEAHPNWRDTLDALNK